MRIELLNKSLEEAYTRFIKGFEHTLLYASVKYRELLKEYTHATDEYLVAIDDNEAIQGVLPLFKKYAEGHGWIYNSLPFYGSNGAIIAADDNKEVRELLINKYLELLQGEDVSAGTIITSPFEANHAFYDEAIKPTYKDSRIGQVTFLPENSEQVMDVIHSKTRNNVRKGIRSDVKVSWEDGLEYLDFLFETHKENMTKIGGLYKPKEFFETVTRIFEYGTDYRIYVAKLGDVPVAALLNFYFNKTAEYFTPVTVEQYREFQPTSVILYTAMQDAVNDGYKWWNWGGTWLSQGGVYDFKKKWGTSDLPYYYYTTIKDEQLVKTPKEILLKEYPYFFALPFNQIQNENIGDSK